MRDELKSPLWRDKRMQWTGVSGFNKPNCPYQECRISYDAEITAKAVHSFQRKTGPYTWEFRFSRPLC